MLQFQLLIFCTTRYAGEPSVTLTVTKRYTVNTQYENGLKKEKIMPIEIVNSASTDHLFHPTQQYFSPARHKHAALLLKKPLNATHPLLQALFDTRQLGNGSSKGIGLLRKG